ncbi:hypothetical protein N4G40_01045 [Pantoea eucrina]|uniref:Transposase n=1 Tax=Pantoea eucrina TaxID=472693 RepID=A0ABU5LAB1_9GAMM|nr:hypothetical protein [Pantoea eucrina]MDZ7276873.1 hypothetical protein [Pantoea eucrina]
MLVRQVTNQLSIEPPRSTACCAGRILAAKISGFDDKASDRQKEGLVRASSWITDVVKRLLHLLICAQDLSVKALSAAKRWQFNIGLAMIMASGIINAKEQSWRSGLMPKYTR